MRLKLMEYNTQDLFLKLAYPLKPQDVEGLSEAEWQQLAAGDDTRLKPLHRLQGMAQAFADIDPDIAMLCEVGGQESLEAFNRLFLRDQYDAYFVAGNSERGIQCGFLVHRDLGLRVEIESHRDVSVEFLYPHEKAPQALAETAARADLLSLPPPGRRRLSRDVPELRLYSGKTPGLIILMTHLKSGLDLDGIDPGGGTRRAAELRAVLNVRAGIARRHGPKVPIILAGDLNDRAGRIDTASAFAAIYRETDLRDALEIAGRHPEDRVTHLAFIGGETLASQLDYILLPRSLGGSVVTEETFVYRYCYPDTWDEIPRPTSYRERSALPSDHYPVVCVVDVETLDP